MKYRAKPRSFTISREIKTSFQVHMPRKVILYITQVDSDALKLLLNERPLSLERKSAAEWRPNDYLQKERDYAETLSEKMFRCIDANATSPHFSRPTATQGSYRTGPPPHHIGCWRLSVRHMLHCQFSRLYARMFYNLKQPCLTYPSVDYNV